MSAVMLRAYFISRMLSLSHLSHMSSVECRHPRCHQQNIVLAGHHQRLWPMTTTSKCRTSLWLTARAFDWRCDSTLVHIICSTPTIPSSVHQMSTWCDEHYIMHCLSDRCQSSYTAPPRPQKSLYTFIQSSKRRLRSDAVKQLSRTDYTAAGNVDQLDNGQRSALKWTVGEFYGDRRSKDCYDPAVLTVTVPRT